MVKSIYKASQLIQPLIHINKQKKHPQSISSINQLINLKQIYLGRQSSHNNNINNSSMQEVGISKIHKLKNSIQIHLKLINYFLFQNQPNHSKNLNNNNLYFIKDQIPFRFNNNNIKLNKHNKSINTKLNN